MFISVSYKLFIILFKFYILFISFFKMEEAGIETRSLQTISNSVSGRYRLFKH